MTVQDNDWLLMREEARLLVEYLRAASPKDPKVPALVQRAVELQRLGFEAEFLRQYTEQMRRH